MTRCGPVDPNVRVNELIAEYSLYSDSEGEEDDDDNDIEIGVEFAAPSMGGFAI